MHTSNNSIYWHSMKLQTCWTQNRLIKKKLFDIITEKSNFNQDFGIKLGIYKLSRYEMPDSD